ncbi:MAG TPA: DsbA family protein [Candidatus Dormibacteraeota bacterium]|nr:DsbA family protein [Candidatus Dormibacteraeota bacterium]
MDAASRDNAPEDPPLTRRPAPPPPQSRKERRRAERDTRRERELRAAQRPAWQSPLVLMTVAAIAIGLVVVGAIALTQGGGGGSGSALASPAEPIPSGVTVDKESMGKATAPVTLTVYSDFQCPSCDLFARQTEPRLRNTYVAQGTLRIVYHDAAFQGQKSSASWDESVEPAAAARCAGEQNHFWEFHDWLFANQHGENQGGFNRDKMNQIAQKIPGLDYARWTSCLDGGTMQALVRQQTQETVGLGIDSTPTLDINGKRIVGAAGYDQIAAAIDAAAGSPAPSGASPSASAAASASASPGSSPSS